jgi:microcystin-dependent protein
MSLFGCSLRYSLILRGCFVSYANMDGVPTQSAGTSEVLASDWNTYVRDNFDAIKFGHVVCTSSTRPSGIAEGTMIYETDTNLVYLYSGSGWSQNNFTPVGMISPFAGLAATVPNGWLLCYGQVLNATADPEYASLWNTIGTTYGGSGIASFNVPDLRGRAVAGVDNMGGSDAGRLSLANTPGTSGGAETHTLVEGQLPSHTHTITDGAGSHSHGVNDPGHAHAIGARPNTTNGATYNGATTATSQGDNGNVVRANTTGISIQSNGGHNHTINATGSGQAHNNLQPTMVLNYIIKY